MKRLLSLSALLLCSVLSFAFEVDEIAYNVTSEEKQTVEVASRQAKYSGDVVIPDKVTYDQKEYTVTRISWHAFEDCSGLTSIDIPNSVTSIGYAAFYGCSGLTSVTIPNSVTSIGASAFRGCSGLTSVTIPNSVTKIEHYAFQGCSGLTSIKVERGNSKYDSRDNCNAIIQTNTNTLIAGCQNTVIPNSVTSIEESAFESCSGLTSIDIPNSVTIIGWGAFRGCSGLTSVDIPNSVTSIEESAFAYSGLTSLTIGNSVTSIGDRAFYDCSGLTSIKVENGNTQYDSRDNCNAIIQTNTNTLIAGCQNTVIPNSVTSIADNSFFGCSGLTSIDIPNSVTSIGSYAFHGCSGLTSVTIPYSVTSIGNVAFSYCSSLTSVTIPNSVTSIGGYAFKGCSSLTEVTIPNSVTSIGFEAFRLCSSLTSVTIGNSVTSIGGGAFSSCRGLTEVAIPKSVTSIGSYAFYDCSSLAKVVTMIKEPFDIETSVWNLVNTDEIPLYVPAGTKEKYEATEGWNVFTNIIEMGIAPSEGEDINYGGGEISGETNLNGNVVGNIYYNIGDENGEYSSAEGCITLRTPVSDEQMSQVEGMDLFGEDMKNNFTGIIFKIEPGSGTVKVTAETTGDMTLKIKIGDGAPMEFKLNGMMEAKLPYTVDVPTYVYIYAGSAEASGAKGARKAAGNGELKIYGIFWGDEETDGIGIIDNGQLTIDNSPIYNLNGQRVESLQKGINIVNGKKVLVQ